MPGTAVDKRPPLPVPVPGMPVRKRESEALVPRAFRSARRNRHVSVPLTVPPGAWTAAQIMHAFGMGGYAGVAGLVLTANIWYFAPRKWDRAAEQWYARLSATAAWLWLWAAASLGATPGTGGPVLTPLLLALGAGWGIPWYLHKRPRGRKDREKLLRDWRAWWEGRAYSWNLAGSRVTAAADDGITVRLRIQLMAGIQTITTVREAIGKIESGLQGFAGPGMVRVQAVKADASQVDVFIKRENPLRHVISWDEKTAPRSVLEPWHPGVTETGQRRAMRQLDSIFAIGEKGSGKSTLLLGRVLSLAGCPDGVSILIDLKGGRSARPVLETGAADYVITDLREAEMALLFAEAEILARMEGAYDGSEQITPTPLTPAIFLHVDETHRLTSATRGTALAANTMEAVATTGRSAVIYPDVFTQHGALDASVRSEATRMNLGVRFAFRMARADLAAYAINEHSRLDVSKLEEPGECYANDKAQTDDEKLRAVNISHDEFRALAPQRIAARGPKPRLKAWCGSQPCPAGGTWQEWWDRRWLRLPEAFRDISPQYAEAAEEFGLPEAEARESSASGAEMTAPASARNRPEGGTSGAEVAAWIAAETSGPDIAPTASAAATATAAGTGTARRQAFCDTLAAAVNGTSPAALMKASGLARSTVMDYLGRLLDRGAVTRPEEGVYMPAPGRDIHAELRAIRGGDAVLRRQALQLIPSAS